MRETRKEYGIFYSYLACFVNTFSLNMCVSMSYTGFTLKKMEFITPQEYVDIYSTRRLLSRAVRQQSSCPAHAQRARACRLPDSTPYGREGLAHSRSLSTARRARRVAYGGVASFINQFILKNKLGLKVPCAPLSETTSSFR